MSERSPETENNGGAIVESVLPGETATARAIALAIARGFRPLEAAISALVGVIVLSFAFQMFYAQPEADRILAGLFTPQFAGTSCPGSQNPIHLTS